MSVASYVKYSYTCIYYYLVVFIIFYYFFFCMYFLFDDMTEVTETNIIHTVFDLISVLFAYVILGQKNRPN